MKKVLSSLSIFILLFLVFSVTKVSAKIISNQKGDVSIGKTEIINDDLFIGAQTSEIDGVINGDVFVASQTIKVTGIINGNLHMGANTIYLGGTVKGNVYAGAQNILVSNANIGGSLIAGAATVNTDKSTFIGGSVITGASSLSIDSQIGRSVYAWTNNLTTGSDAKIKGSIYDTKMNKARTNINMNDATKQIPAVLNSLKFGFTIISFLGALIIGFLYLQFFGKHFSGTSKLISNSFLKSLGIGFLVSISFIPGMIILFITIIGIPVAGVAVLMLILYWYLSKIVVGAALGNWISEKFKWKTSTYGAFAIGLFAFYILKMIPFVGFLTGLIVFWTGLGALTLQMLTKNE